MTTRTDAAAAGGALGADGALAADRELKAKHRAMWALGDYPALARDVIPGLGAALVEACGVGPGDRVLDVAAGAGNAAIPAAMAGASVVACDLTPELLDAGRREAEAAGVRIEWREADAEALPFGAGEFDVVLSCVGVMFAPHHQACADELVRVCKPGGRIGLANWTPEGFVGQMFTAMKPYAPAPPPGAQPPPLWGSDGHVRSLLGDQVGELQARRRSVRVDVFPSPEAFRDCFKERYGPTVAAYRGIAGEPERVAALDAALADLARRHDLGAGAAPSPRAAASSDPGAGRSVGETRAAGATVMDWEYLLVTARKRG